MAHNDYVIPYSLWSDKSVPAPSTLRKLDQIVSESINGNEGGTWNPEKQIIIGGQGLACTANGTFSGGVQTKKKSRAGGALILGDNDWPTYPSARSRTIVIPIRSALGIGDFGQSDISGITHEGIPGITQIGLSQPGLPSTSNLLRIPLPSNRLPRDGIITGATLKFRLGGRPVAIAATANLPKFTIVGHNYDATQSIAVCTIPVWQASHTYSNNATTLNTNGYVVGNPQRPVAFKCTVSGVSGGTQPAAFATAIVGQTVADGGVTWSCFSIGNMVNWSSFFTRVTVPISVSEYYAEGQPKSITLVSPNVHQIIDTDNFTYFLNIIDNSYDANCYLSLSLTYTSTSMIPGI